MKIHVINGQPFQECMWSGTLITSRYGVPKQNGEREGCFKNAACAVSFYLKQLEEGRIDKKKFGKIAEAIYRDLNLATKQRELIKAPEIDPSKPDWTWVDACPWMEVQGLHVPAEDDFRNKRRKTKDPEPSQRFVHLYILESEAKPIDQIEHRSLTTDSPIDIESAKATYHCKMEMGTYKGRDFVIISLCDSTKPNELANSLFEQTDKFYGTCYLLSKKPLPGFGEKKKTGATKTTATGEESSKPLTKKNIVQFAEDIENFLVNVPEIEPAAKKIRTK